MTVKEYFSKNPRNMDSVMAYLSKYPARILKTTKGAYLLNCEGIKEDLGALCLDNMMLLEKVQIGMEYIVAVEHHNA